MVEVVFRLKTLLAFLSFVFLLSACSGGHETIDAEINDVVSENGINISDGSSFSDTIHQFTGLHEFNFDGPKSYDTLIIVNDKVFRLHLECELDPIQRVAFTEKIPQKDKLYSNTYVGYQGHYIFSLFDNEKQLFKRKLTKEDFKESVYSIVLESDAFLPNFIEYNKAFDAFIFECPFYLDGSCWSTKALLVLGIDGEVQLIDYLSVPMSNSTNWDVQFTPNHDALVTHTAIHFPNGKSTEFGNSLSGIMGTDVFDDCLLVVYEFDKKNHPKNAYLKDYNGKTLLNFNYEGWTGALGYSFLRKKVKDAYYFIDEPNKRLIQLRKRNNKWTLMNLSFDQMVEFDGEEYLADQVVDFFTEITTYSFYINIESGNIRKITPEEY